MIKKPTKRIPVSKVISEPGTYCSSCGKQITAQKGFNYEMVDTPHLNLRDCVDYLRSIISSIKSDLEDVAARSSNIE